MRNRKEGGWTNKLRNPGRRQLPKLSMKRDVRDRLTELIDRGLGDLAAQVVIVPDSTMQAIARDAGHTDGRPALMIDLDGDGERMPVYLMSTARLRSAGGDFLSHGEHTFWVELEVAVRCRTNL